MQKDEVWSAVNEAVQRIVTADGDWGKIKILIDESLAHLQVQGASARNAIRWLQDAIVQASPNRPNKEGFPSPAPAMSDPNRNLFFALTELENRQKDSKPA